LFLLTITDVNRICPENRQNGSTANSYIFSNEHKSMQQKSFPTKEIHVKLQ